MKNQNPKESKTEPKKVFHDKVTEKHILEVDGITFTVDIDFTIGKFTVTKSVPTQGNENTFMFRNSDPENALRVIAGLYEAATLAKTLIEVDKKIRKAVPPF